MSLRTWGGKESLHIAYSNYCLCIGPTTGFPGETTCLNGQCRNALIVIKAGQLQIQTTSVLQLFAYFFKKKPLTTQTGKKYGYCTDLWFCVNFWYHIISGALMENGKTFPNQSPIKMGKLESGFER